MITKSRLIDGENLQNLRSQFGYSFESDDENKPHEIEVDVLSEKALTRAPLGNNYIKDFYHNGLDVVSEFSEAFDADVEHLAVEHAFAFRGQLTQVELLGLVQQVLDGL